MPEPSSDRGKRIVILLSLGLLVAGLASAATRVSVGGASQIGPGLLRVAFLFVLCYATYSRSNWARITLVVYLAYLFVTSCFHMYQAGSLGGALNVVFVVLQAVSSLVLALSLSVDMYLLRDKVVPDVFE